MLIREIRKDEIPFLWDMLYEALFVPEGEDPYPKTILENPSISKYLNHFGNNPNDLALVAEHNRLLIGAIWGRSFPVVNPGYGFIAENIPEISIAVSPAFRNKGVGTHLLNHISLAIFGRKVNR